MKISFGSVAAIARGQSVEKKMLARRVSVFNLDGELIGIETDCKHMRASLSGGEVKDGVVTCSWHGWQYDLHTGECLTTPGVRLKRFPVSVEDGTVFVEM